jgi:predicted lipoprotein with Yx(FWY)xxD motif
MNRRRFLGVLAASTTTALAGCPTDSQDVPEGTPAPTTAADTTTETAQQTTEATDQATVAVRSTDEYGDVLADSEGMSLYLFTQDEGGESACYDDCASAWPPLTVDGEPTAGPDVTAELGTIEREDGSTQVTAAGNPLYYFAQDSEPGDTAGQGVSDVWFLLAPDGSQIGGTAETTAEPTTTESDESGGGGGDGNGGGAY